MESALVHRGFAEEAERHLVPALIFRGESGARRQRNLTSDNRVAAKEAEALVKHVHRAALAFGTACGFSEELSHDGSGCHSFCERQAVFAITRKHVVIFSNRRDRADADCFLADVKVTKAADLTGDVSFRRLLFE